MSQYTSVGLPCPLPSQLLSCSVIFPVHCTVSSLVLFLKSIFFSWEEGQDKRSSIRFSVVNNPWQSCKMNKGGAPSGQRAATQKRLRDIAEEMNPDAKTQREEVGKEAKRNFFSRDITRQSLPNIDIEMSSEPTATPVFTTRTTPVADPLLALHPPPKKIDQRVDGQVYRHEDGLLKGVRVKWSASSKTYFCTCDLSVHQGNCKTSRCPLLTGKRTSASTDAISDLHQAHSCMLRNCFTSHYHSSEGHLDRQNASNDLLEWLNLHWGCTTKIPVSCWCPVEEGNRRGTICCSGEQDQGHSRIYN